MSALSHFFTESGVKERRNQVDGMGDIAIFSKWDRRELLVSLVQVACGATLANLVPRAGRADEASAADVVAEIIGARDVTSDGIAIEAPALAENGQNVPVTVAVDSPMTPDAYVRSLHILADGNPQPNVAAIRFGPHSGVAWASLRIRLSKPQALIAIATMSDDTVRLARRDIQVTVGGCG